MIGVTPNIGCVCLTMLCGMWLVAYYVTPSMRVGGLSSGESVIMFTLKWWGFRLDVWLWGCIIKGVRLR